MLYLTNTQRNTSRKCPKCSYISAENRKTQATFCCQQKHCNYTANADYVGSLNIREARFTQIYWSPCSGSFPCLPKLYN